MPGDDSEKQGQSRGPDSLRVLLGQIGIEGLDPTEELPYPETLIHLVNATPAGSAPCLISEAGRYASREEAVAAIEFDGVNPTPFALLVLGAKPHMEVLDYTALEDPSKTEVHLTDDGGTPRSLKWILNDLHFYLDS